MATIAQELVRIGVAPVLVKTGAEAQILDSVAARVQKGCDGTGFGNRAKAHDAMLTPFSRSAPRCGEPRHTT